MSESSASVAVGVDLGGTNLKIAAVDQVGTVLAAAVTSIAPDPGPAAVLNRIADGVRHIAKEAGREVSDIIGVGVGTPGPLNLKEGTIVRAANLPGWRNVRIRAHLEKKLDMAVAFDNDGNAAAFGEYWAGAGRQGGDMVMLTLGTGVGGGVILDGRILHGHFDNAGELGHMIVVRDGLPCSCGQCGCLEQYASASAVARRASAAVAAGERTSLVDASRGDGVIDAKLVAEHAAADDETAERVWDEACSYLAIACINIQHAYNPERVILGGGMGLAGNFLIDCVRKHLQALRWSLHDDLPDVVSAALEYDAGVIGAAGLAWEAFGIDQGDI